MKKCPNCSLLFSSDEAFCVECGTPLLTHFDDRQSSSRFNVSVEQPTQAVYQPYQHRQQFPPPFQTPYPASPVAANNSRWLYVVTGAITAVILGTGVFFLLLRGFGENEVAVLVNANKTEEKSNAANSSASPNANSAETPAPTIEKTPKPASVNTPKTYFPLTRNFNRTYGGSAGGDSVTMRLQRSGSSLSGRVFSRRSATEISVSGSIYDDGTFELGEYSDIGAMTGSYSGRIYTDGTMTGTWSKPDGSKPRPIFLRAN